MRLAVAIAVVGLLGVATPLFADVSAPAASAIAWRTDLEAATRDADKLHRPLLVFFSAAWCMPCLQMKRQSFTDPAVIELVSRRFVPLLVDMTDDGDATKALGERFGVRALPTLVVRRGPTEALRLESFAAADKLRAALDRVR